MAEPESVAAVTQDGDAVVVKLSGELDLSTADMVRGALLEGCARSPERVVVDLSAVEFMDSTTLGVLVDVRARLPNGCRLVLAAPAREARRALEVTGLDRHLGVHETVAEALAAPLDSRS
jgi:anti-anti-sigma factor